MGKLQKKALRPPDENVGPTVKPKPSKSLFSWRSKDRKESIPSEETSARAAFDQSYHVASEAKVPVRPSVAPPARLVATGGLGETDDYQRIAQIIDREDDLDKDHDVRARLVARAELQSKKVERRRQLNLPEAPSNSHDSRLLQNLDSSLAQLAPELWAHIAGYLRSVDAANLALSSKLFRYRLGAQPWRRLSLPLNYDDKVSFLLPFDLELPNHLFCFPCAAYHLRTDPSQEQLYASYIEHPVFACPNALHKPLPKTRLANGRDLPFYLIQLAMRANRYTLEYGIPLSKLARAWRCYESEWSHRSRFHIHKSNGHLMMRITSTIFAAAHLTPSEERLLLFSRNDYLPYFSVCAHWNDGDLIPIAKCALSHIPGKGIGLKEQMRREPGKTPSLALRKTDFLPRQCDECACLRRCPRCPTEYLVEIKLTEDPKDKVNRFKHALCVTRWSDLGDGTSPASPEWMAIHGKGQYDSFGAVGNATICSHFEMTVSNGAPNQRARSLGEDAWRMGDVY